MPLRRIWVDEPPQTKNFELTGDAFHHAFRVSRFKAGEQFEIVSGGEKALVVQVIEVGKKSAVLETVEERDLPLRKNPPVGLAICVPKWPTWDWIIEKSVELGVSEIQPLISTNSFLRSPKEFSPSKAERTEKIIRAALEQSGWGGRPKLHAAANFKEWAQTVNPTKGEVGLMAYEAETVSSPRRVLEDLPRDLSKVWLVIGAEGGFTEEEADFLKSRQFKRLSLGRVILRSETACLTMLSVIRYQLDLFS